ncbi:succinate dehydrogenase [Thiocapsa roseopersicina]|uniref:Succinate dehydrogenase subunit C n=1 Tax=Thiocapsa roseopersicina TaxID=1058 RepID=A0A1H3BXX2_THIRO|nr:succinate dehydrogenase [Thiocapsa roseopersicina]SDX46723.1 succinate dehydrogenase subunit C [Thiocapsa roseopersicina]
MSASIDNPHFLLRRLHSLLGLLPVGAFLIFHLWENSQSRFGAEHYNEHVVAALKGMNYLPLMEIFVIALPLLFHAGYGLVITAQMRAELARYSYTRNRLYWMQRVSGIGILLFLLLHVGMTRIAGFWDPSVGDDLFAHMQAMLIQPWMLGLYLVGLLLSVFHLANGLASMAIVWGLTTSVRGQTLFGWVCVLIGVLLAAMGIHGLMGFLS